MDNAEDPEQEQRTEVPRNTDELCEIGHRQSCTNLQLGDPPPPAQTTLDSSGAEIKVTCDWTDSTLCVCVCVCVRTQGPCTLVTSRKGRGGPGEGVVVTAHNRLWAESAEMRTGRAERALEFGGMDVHEDRGFRLLCSQLYP